jgi:hypothetical protein
MAILQGLCSSFKQESWLGIHDLDTDVLKFVGAGYTVGGEILTGVQVLLSGTTAYVTFNNPVWTGASFTCRGGLIYNTSKANRAIAVIDFGADKTASGTFTITLPQPTATTALLRFA